MKASDMEQAGQAIADGLSSGIRRAGLTEHGDAAAPDCGGDCALSTGHEPPCRCVGDDGDGCPA